MLRRTCSVSALAVLLMLPAALLRADVPKTGDKDLEGDWEVKSALKDGKDASPPVKAVMTFKGDSATMKMGDMTHTATIQVDATKTPRAIDVTPQDGPEKDKMSLCIYEVKDDELNLCVADPGKDRPKELSGKEGSGNMLITLKRVKKRGGATPPLHAGSHPAAQPVDPLRDPPRRERRPIHRLHRPRRRPLHLRQRRERHRPVRRSCATRCLSRVGTVQSAERSARHPGRGRGSNSASSATAPFDTASTSASWFAGRKTQAYSSSSHSSMTSPTLSAQPRFARFLRRRGRGRCVGRKPMLLPWSSPAWTSASTLSGGQSSPAGHASGRGGYSVLALTPTSSPSLTRLRHSDFPTGGIQYAWPSVTSGLSWNWPSFMPRATTTSPMRSTLSVEIHDTSLRSPGFSSVGGRATRALRYS